MSIELDAEAIRARYQPTCDEILMVSSVQILTPWSPPPASGMEVTPTVASTLLRPQWRPCGTLCVGGNRGRHAESRVLELCRRCSEDSGNSHAPVEASDDANAGLDRVCAGGHRYLPCQAVSYRAAEAVQDVCCRRQCRHTDLLGSMVQICVQGAGNRRNDSSREPWELPRLLGRIPGGR